MSDDAKRIILARRAKFVAAAVASVGIACGKTTGDHPSPQPCLSVAIPTSDAAPMPCLEPTLPIDGGAADASDATDAGSADATDAQPQPCLSQVAPRKDAGAATKRRPAQPCLIAPTEDE